MLTRIYDKGIIADHVEKKIKKILKTRWFTAFFVRREENQKILKCLFLKQPSYVGQFLTNWVVVFEADLVLFLSFAKRLKSEKPKNIWGSAKLSGSYKKKKV